MSAASQLDGYSMAMEAHRRERAETEEILAAVGDALADQAQGKGYGLWLYLTEAQTSRCLSAMWAKRALRREGTEQ